MYYCSDNVNAFSGQNEVALPEIKRVFVKDETNKTAIVYTILVSGIFVWLEN